MKKKLKNNYQKKFLVSALGGIFILLLILIYLISALNAYNRAQKEFKQAELDGQEQEKLDQQKKEQEAENRFESEDAEFDESILEDLSNPEFKQNITATPVPPTPTNTPTPTPTPKPTTVSVTLSGFIYEDKNCNYKYDGDEVPMSHVKVSIYQFSGDKVYTLSSKTYGEDGKYSFSKDIGLNDTLIIQPGPYKYGYSFASNSGVPEKLTFNRNQTKVVQNLPMIKWDEMSKCF